MRIGFIAEPYEEKNASGMGYAVHESMRHMVAEAHGAHEFVFYCSSPIRPDFIRGNYSTVHIPKGFVRQFFWFLVHKPQADVLFFMVPLLPLWLWRGPRTIPICQELASLKVKPKGVRAKIQEGIRNWLMMPLTFALADRIIVPSEATKLDVQHFYGISEKKLVLIFNGFQNLQGIESVAPATELSPYFFFAGRVKRRKNVHGIVSAFMAFKERTGASAKLLIAGGYGGEYYDALLRTLRVHRLEKDVCFLGYVSTEALKGLFEHAVAYVYPSLNEGFGMPILEAMSLGTPVITSSISSMAEVAGDAAVLVNPEDVQGISEAMEKVYTDAAFRRDVITRGYARAKEFSWPKAARAYLALASSI